MTLGRPGPCIRWCCHSKPPLARGQPLPARPRGSKELLQAPNPSQDHHLWGVRPLQTGAAVLSPGGPPCWSPVSPTKRWQALNVRLDTMRRQGEQSAVAQLSGRKRVWPTEVRELGTCQLSRKGAGSSASPTAEPSFRVRSLAASPSQTPESGRITPVVTVISTTPSSPAVTLNIPHNNSLRLVLLLSPFYR